MLSRPHSTVLKKVRYLCYVIISVAQFFSNFKYFATNCKVSHFCEDLWNSGANIEIQYGYKSIIKKCWYYIDIAILTSLYHGVALAQKVDNLTKRKNQKQTFFFILHSSLSRFLHLPLSYFSSRSRFAFVCIRTFCNECWVQSAPSSYQLLPGGFWLVEGLEINQCCHL